MRRSVVPLLLLGSLALGGCAASIAAGLASAAVRAASPSREVDPNLDLRAPAREACRQRAAQHGQVHLIDAEQRGGGRVVVWGTVQGQQERRAFECAFDRRVTAFRLRAIRQPSAAN